MFCGSIAVGVITLSLLEISSTKESEQPKNRTKTKTNIVDEVGRGGHFHNLFFKITLLNLEKFFE